MGQKIMYDARLPDLERVKFMVSTH